MHARLRLYVLSIFTFLLCYAILLLNSALSCRHPTMREMLKLRAFFVEGIMEKRIAILVDGGFYQKRIHALKDFDTPKRSVDFFY